MHRTQNDIYFRKERVSDFKNTTWSLHWIICKDKLLGLETLRHKDALRYVMTFGHYVFR
jgi:hypothetical protein